MASVGASSPTSTDPRNAFRRRAEEERQRDSGEDEREHAGRERDGERFRHLEAHELRARRADRAAHGEVASPRLRAHQEQVGDVGARDQQHHGHRAEENEERCLQRRSDDAVEHRHHHRAVLIDEARVDRRVAPKRAGSSFVSRVSSDANWSAVTPCFMRATDRRAEVAGADLGEPNLARHPEHRLVAREAELRRHDADDLLQAVGDEVPLADHRRVASEPGAPQLIADHHDVVVVRRDGKASELRPNPERGVHVVGRPRHRNALDAIAGAERRRADCRT